MEILQIRLPSQRTHILTQNLPLLQVLLNLSLKKLTKRQTLKNLSKTRPKKMLSAISSNSKVSSKRLRPCILKTRKKLSNGLLKTVRPPILSLCSAKVLISIKFLLWACLSRKILPDALDICNSWSTYAENITESKQNQLSSPSKKCSQGMSSKIISSSQHSSTILILWTKLTLPTLT